MRLRQPEDLEARLAQGLAPVYLVSGDEPLLVQEAGDAIRTAARAAGVEEREVFHVEAGFKWDELRQSASSMSLFASRRLKELRCASSAPGTEGSKVLVEYAEKLPGDDVLLILMPRVEKRQESSKWYKALDAVGVTLQVWPLGIHDFPRWLDKRLGKAGVRLERDALSVLAAQVEGNLLAAAQAVTRLELVAREAPWSADDLLAVLDDESRYTAFEFADQVLGGNAAHAHRMLATLRQEGIDALAISAALAWSIRQARSLRLARDGGESMDSAMRRLRIMGRRQKLLQQALGRLSPTLLDGALRDLALVDQAVKGLLAIDPWDELDRLALRVAGVRTTPLGLRARQWLEGF